MLKKDNKKKENSMNFGIILAGGKGTRMKTDLPKCAMPILGKPMVSYLIDSLAETTIDKSIVVLGHKKEDFYEIIGDKAEIVVQEKQLGRANAVNCCRDIVGDNVGYSIIVNGDTPLIDRTIIQGLIDTYFKDKSKLALATIKVDNPKGRGRILRNEAGKIVKVIKEDEATEAEKKITEVNTGFMCVDNQILFETLKHVDNNNPLGEYFLTDIVELIAKNHNVTSFSIDASYKLDGINDLFHLYEVEKELKFEINKRHMLNGVRLESADTITIGPDVIIEPNAIIRSASTLLGKTIVESYAIVGPNTELNNGIVREGARVNHSLINDSELGKNATLGPYSHLRAGTVVGEGDRIGNFVEIKNSTLGPKTNVAHLTYIGDTTCGGGVNWGCGTVTINYDGHNKYKTKIGDNVFIGCNSNLVAPINIGSNTFIAAGSTVTDDLDDGDFTVARMRQVTKKGYASKYGFKKI